MDKYRGDPTDLVTYAEIARTFTSAVLQLGLPLYNGSDNIFIFTSAYDVTVACKTVMGNKDPYPEQGHYQEQD